MTLDGGAAPPGLPAVPGDFHWTTESWGSALRCEPVSAIASHLFTTRQLDLGQSEDVHRLGASLGVARVVMVHQVHQAHVVVVRDGVPTPEGRPEGDVLISNHPDVAIAVRAADCVPVLIADRSTGTVAAVHAGWRGTAAKAAMAAVVALRGEFGADPHTMVAAIGPSIGRCCYEVGSELVDAFAAAGHERYLIERWFVAPPPGRGSRARATRPECRCARARSQGRQTFAGRLRTASRPGCGGAREPRGTRTAPRTTRAAARTARRPECAAWGRARSGGCTDAGFTAHAARACGCRSCGVRSRTGHARRTCSSRCRIGPGAWTRC